jgi:hypothetical protein
VSGYGPFLGHGDDTNELRRSTAGLVCYHGQLSVDLHGIDGQRGYVPALCFSEPLGKGVGEFALATRRGPANYQPGLFPMLCQP